MPQKLDYLRETASQTAGPYVHIGLAPGAAGFDIYERELGWDIAGPNAGGERIPCQVFCDTTWLASGWGGDIARPPYPWDNGEGSPRPCGGRVGKICCKSS